VRDEHEMTLVTQVRVSNHRASFPPLKLAQGEESGDSPQVNLVVVCTSYMNSVRNKPLNVGEVLRPTSEINSDATSVFVASHLVCDVISEI